MVIADFYNLKLVEETVARVEQDPLYWFPVRHHSPATAWHLQAAILERRPKLILIEGPAQANHLIPILLGKKTKPPVAIYSSFQDDSNHLGWAGIQTPSVEIPARWACWYPFLEYSPEFVAIGAGEKIGAKVQFMDLPHFARIEKFDAIKDELETDSENESETDPSSAEEVNDADTNSLNYETERLIAGSDFYQSLAAAGGYKSWDEGWDSLFEFRQFASYESFRHELLTFCAAARQTSEKSQSDMAETLDRERFMMQTIRESIEQHGVDASEVMIVCGGFHCSLDQNDSTPPPELPQGTVYSTVVPYSFFQISDLSGYGAGNRAPRFYGSHWQQLIGNNDAPLASYTVDVLQQARKLGESVSSADAISITQHARMLAGLRGRSTPVLDDMHDAIMTCCCKGNPIEQGAGLSRAIDEIDIGNQIGKVPPDSPRLPIVADFYAQIESLELGDYILKERAKKLTLDRREQLEFEQASFLHRLAFTKVPFCQIAGTPENEFETGLIFREVWQLKWSPKVDSRLIDLNLLGDSLEVVAVNELKRRISDISGNAGQVCELLVAAMQMNLPNLLAEVFEIAISAIEEDGRFVSLTHALTQLRILDRYAMHHEMRRQQIQEMLTRAFERACFAMADIVTAPDKQHQDIVGGLTTMADAHLRGDLTEFQSNLFADSVTTTLEETKIPFLQGALLGTLVEIKLRPSGDVTTTIVGFAMAAQDRMAQAGDFVFGVISVSRTAIMTGSSQLVEALDQLVRNCDWETFTTILPRLRGAMELLHQRQRDSLAVRVAETYGLVESTNLQQLDVSSEMAKTIVELDLKVAEIMKRWSFVE